MKDFDRYAQENGFQLQLGRWDFVYAEDQKRLTLPVEMLMQGEYIWELARSRIMTWDPPFDTERIDEMMATKILERVEKFVELTGKKLRIV